MSIDMNKNYVKLLLDFRRQDLPNFISEHDRLYKKAKASGDHLDVTSHYYSLMSNVINDFFGGNFHFASPEDDAKTLEEALADLHRAIGKKMNLSAGVSCVDIGCGIGGVIKDLAYTGASLTGITIAANEAEMGNNDFRQLGIENTCRLIQGDCHSMPLDNSTQDAAYAIYSLKYFPRLDGVISEVSRVLRPGGKFVVYDLIKTEDYDENIVEHREIVEGLEYACGMPSLHTKQQMIDSAEKYGMKLIEEEDVEETNDSPFHYCFSHSPLFMWLVRSPFIGTLMTIGESLRILPKGFRQFNSIFLAGTVNKIVTGGQMGILSGSQIFTAHFGNPAGDLSRLFNTSLTGKDRRKHTDVLLKKFYKLLTEELRGEPAPYTFEQLKRSYELYFPMGAYIQLHSVGLLLDLVVRTGNSEEKHIVNSLVFEKTECFLEDLLAHIGK